MSKFFKSLLLLLSAGVFVATSWAVTLIDPNPTAIFTDFSTIPTGTTEEAKTLTVNGIEWVLPVGVTKNEDGTINLNAVGSEIRFPAAQDHISIVLDLAAAPTVSGAILDYGKVSLYYTANSELKALWEGGEWGTATAWTWSETNTKVMLAMAKANNDGTTYAADGITALTQASLRATGDTYTNAYIGCCDGDKKYANLKVKGVYVYSNSKLTEMPTFTGVSAYERTIEGTKDWVATDAWATGVANPEAGTSATLNVTGDAELTMNDASNDLNYLEIKGSGSLTITGSNPLTAASTIVKANTIVETSASLGAVTLENDVTLTVKSLSAFTSIAGVGTLALDLGAEENVEYTGEFPSTVKLSLLSGTLTYKHNGAHRAIKALNIAEEATFEDVADYKYNLTINDKFSGAGTYLVKVPTVSSQTDGWRYLFVNGDAAEFTGNVKLQIKHNANQNQNGGAPYRTGMRLTGTSFGGTVTAEATGEGVTDADLAYAHLDIDESLTMTKAQSFAGKIDIASGKTLTASNGITLTNAGKLEGTGTIAAPFTYSSSAETSFSGIFSGDLTVSAGVLEIATKQNSVANTVGVTVNGGVLRLDVDHNGINDGNVVFAEGRTITVNAGGVLELERGYGYFKISGNGLTKVVDSNFYFGVSGDGTNNITTALEVAADKTFWIRNWGGTNYKLTPASVTLNGNLKRDTAKGNGAFTVETSSLKGSGTVEGMTLALADNATIDVTSGAVNATTTATLPSAFMVKITADQDATGVVTVMTSPNVVITDKTATVWVGEAKAEYTLHADVATVWVEKSGVELLETVEVAFTEGGTLVLSDALDGKALAPSATLAINFGDKGENEPNPGIFEFDCDAAFAQITITGTNGGTITKTGTVTVTASSTTIDADTTVNAGAANLGTVTINAEKTLTVKENWANIAKNVPTTATNLGKIRFDGGSAETPIVFSMGSSANANPGALVMAPGAVVKLTATGGNKLYNITGETGGDKANVLLYSGQNWGMTDGSVVRDVKLIVPSADNHDFWLRPGVTDATVDLELQGRKLTGDSGDGAIVLGDFVTNAEVVANGKSLSVQTGRISGTAGFDSAIAVDNSGEGTFTVARTYGAALTINDNGSVTVAEGGSLTGSVTVTGKLTYAADATPTNTITNNGTITADGEGTEVDLTSTPISGTGTYAVTNDATLILPVSATIDKTITVADGATLKVALAANEQLADQSVTVTGGSVQFVDANNHETVLSDGNTYTAPLNTWTNSARDAAWDTTSNWSNGTVPGDADNVEIQIAEDTELVLTGDVTVAALRVMGTGTLSITGGKLTATFIDAQANISADETKLALAPMNIAQDKTVTYATETTKAHPDMIGSSEHELSLKDLTGAGTFVKTGAGVIALFKTKVEPAIIIEDGAIYVRDVPTTAMNIAVKANKEIRLAAWQCNFSNNANSLKLEGGSLLTLANGENVSGTITIENATETPAKICGSSFGVATISAAITGSGKVEFADGGAFGEAVEDRYPFPCDNETTYSGVISGALQVIISDAQPVTFAGANTYTGGTEIVTGAQLINDNGSALGTGKVTGAGTLIVNIGKHPGNHDEFGFAEAGWQGTVEFTGGNFATSVDFAKWQNANSTFKVASGATISAADSSSVAGTLMGGGTINNTLTFASGATIDTTAGTLTANTLADLPAELTVKVANALEVGGTLDIMTTTATPNTASTTVTVKVGGTTAEGTYTLTATGTVLQLARVEDRVIVEEVTATMTDGAASYRDVIANVDGELANNFTLKIDFGSEGSAGIFTFDNDDNVTLANVLIQGTNGGSIVKTGTGTVTATATTIKEGCTVTVTASTAVLGAVAVEANATIVVADVTTITSATGVGTIAYNGVLPENVTGTNAATWTGTVELSSVEVPEETYLTLNNYGNSASKICLNGVTNIGFVQNNSATQTYAGALCIEGTNTVTKAGEYSQLYLLGAIEGEGVLDLALVKNHNYCITGSLENFSGTLKNAASTNTKVILGSASWTTWNDFDTYTNSHAGKLIVDGTYVLSGSGTYQFVNGIFVCQTATLKGAVILKGALILEAGATIDASEALLTVTGDVTLPTALTVKVATEPTMTVPVTILNTTATPNTASTTVTVKMGNETLEGPFELIKNGEALQVRVAPDRIAASEVAAAPMEVTEVPSAIFLDTATFSGYGQTFTVLQYTGTGTPGWEGMYVEGLPAGVTKDDFVIDEENKTWGFKNHTLTVWPIGDSITAGLVKYNEGGSANWHVAGGYRLPLYQFLDQADYGVNYIGTSLYPASQTNDSCSNSCEDRDIDSKILKAAGLLHHEGHSGTTLDQLYARFKKAEVQTILAGQGTPDVITLHLGTNDFGGGNSVDTVKTEMKQLLYVLNGAAAEGYTSEDTPLYPNAKVLVAKIIPRSDKDVAANLNAFNEWLETYAAACPGKLILVDLGMDTSYTLLRHDGLHPFAEGYKQMARGWFAAIEKTIAPLKATATIAAVDARVANTLTVTTNKAIDTSLTQTWTLDKDVMVTAATIADDKRTVTLTVEGVVANTEYTLTATNLFDADDSVAKTFTTTADIHAPTTDVTETLATESASKLDGVTKAAEWTTFADFATGFTSPIGCMPESGRAWQLDVRGANVPTVNDGVLSLNGAPLTVNFVDGHIGNTSSTYTVVMTVSNLAVNDVLITESMAQYTNNGSVEGTPGGTNAEDAIQLKVKNANTLVWGTTDIPVDVDLTDNEPDTIALSGKWVNGNNYSVAVNGGAKTALSVSGASQTIRDSWSIGALSTADTGSSMKLYRLSFYEGVATLPPPPSVIVNVGEYASWNDAAKAGAVSATMTATTVHFTEPNQTFTFNNTDAVRLGIVTVTAEDGVTGGTIALGNGTVASASLSLQTNVTAPVAFYNACTGTVTAASATTVVAMNDATEATLTTPIVGGVLKQVGEGTVTFAPTGNWTASTSPAKFEVANGSLVLNKTSTGWNNPPQLIVSGGTLDLNNTYTFATGGSGYLKNVANEALVVMGGTEASTVTNGAITPYTQNANTASTIIKYNGAEGANAPATFAANIAGVYSDGDHPRLINVEQGKQTDGYDLEISGTMGVEGQQFAGTTVKKTGAGVLKISGENNFNTLEVTEGTLWSANANALSATTKVKSGATLVGAGTVETAFTLEAGATLDVTKGVVTANGTVTLPEGVLNVMATGEIADQQILAKADADVTEETRLESVTVLVNGEDGYYVAQTAEGYVLREETRVKDLNATVSPGGTLTFVDLVGGQELAANATLTIDFGSEGGEAGTFTFDNPEDVTLGAIVVQGTNGGMIAKTGTGTVETATTTIEEGCAVTLPASTAVLGAVAIETGATIQVADATTVTSVTGTGTLVYNGVLPADTMNTCFTDAEAWTGTVKLLNGASYDNLNLASYQNVNSTIEIENVTCHLSCWNNGTTTITNLRLTGEGLQLDNGTSTNGKGGTLNIATLSGDGKFKGVSGSTQFGYKLFVTDARDFTGELDLSTTGSGRTSVVIGSATTDYDGTIVIAAPVAIAQNKTWTATNGISVTGEGTIAGPGKFSIPSGKALTYASTAASTFNGVIEGAGGLTVSTGTLALTGANTYNGATTIEKGATLALSGENVLSAVGAPAAAVTVNGELYIDGNSTSFYRVVNGGGKITIPTGKTLFLGAPWKYKDNPAGLYGFTGELEIAGTFDARSWSGSGTTYALTGFDVVLNKGQIVCTLGSGSPADLASATLTIATNKKLSGSGTINIPLTLAEGATIDVTGDVVTANTVAALPASLSIMVNELPTEGNPVTLLNTTAFAGNEGYASVALTVNGEATEDYILHKTATALTLVPTPSWTTVTEVTAEGDVNSWSELLADMAAKRQQFDTTEGATPSLVIDFGDKGEDEATPGTFTFDLEDATALSLTKVTIQGTNGGTIQKSGTANVTATATVVNTNVEIAANAMLLGQTTLAANCMLTVNDANALGEAANFAADATSTVKLVNVDKNTLNLGKLVPNGSNLILNNVKAYIYDCTIGTLTLEGDFQMNNGTTEKRKTQCVTVNNLAGAGAFIGHQSLEVCIAMNVKSWTNFTGSIDLSNEKSKNSIFFFGTAPERFTNAASNAYDEDDAQEYFANDYGTVYVTAGNTVATVATSTWKLQKLVVETNAAFQINGWATIATSCTGAVTVENGGVLDLRALDDLSGINATVKDGGRILVKSGATVPDSIVFEAGSILGVATKHVEDVGNATLTVNVDGTAATVPTIKGYHTDGVTELDNWAKNDETSSEGEFKFNFDPVFDGELCWWAYEFDNEVNTSPESNLGPISTGRDKGRMNFDGRGDSNRVCQDNEYLDHGDGTKAIRVASSPWRNVDGGYPTAFTAAMYGTLTENRNRIIMGFGSSYNQKYTIALVTGASTDEVRLVLQKGWNENNTDYPEDAVITLATTTVPNAVTENHLFAFSYEQFDSEDDDEELDSTRIIFYVDGEKYQPFTAKAIIPLGNGFQMGSIHGGWHNSLTRMNGDDVDCTMEYLRIYDQILPESVWTAMSNEYSYMSKNGRATREIVEGQDTTWNEGTEWTQVRAVKDGNGDYVLDAEGHVTFDNGTPVEKPDHGENVGTQVVLNVSGENTLFLNEFYSSPIQDGEVSKFYYERLEINPVEGGDEDSLTLWAGRLNPAITEEDPLKNSQSAVITVQGYTKINTNVTMAHNVAFLSGPVAVAEGKTLTFDFSGFDVMKVPMMPTEYRLTGFLDEDTRTRVTHNFQGDNLTVNARWVDLSYKDDVNQYTFKVDRYPVTAYFRNQDDIDLGADGVNASQTAIDFNNLYYMWEGLTSGKRMDWDVDTVDADGNHVDEHILANFVSVDAETQQPKIVTVTLDTINGTPIDLTLPATALKKTVTHGNDGNGDPIWEEVNMLGAEQLIVAEKVTVNYTGENVSTLAPFVKEASGMVKATAMGVAETTTEWRGNLTLDNGEDAVAIAGTNTISGKLVLGESITLATGATLSAKDADFTAVKTITVDYEEAVAAGTYKVVGLEAGHTAKSLIGCVVTAVKNDASTVEWTEAEGTLVVVRADGLYVVARPDVTVTTNETTKVIKNEDLTLPLARRAAELSATSVSLTGVVNMAGDEVKGVSVADAAEVFTNVAFDMTETPDGEGVVTAKLKYDFGVSQINVVTIESVQYVVAELIVSNNKELGQNTAAYAADTTIDVVVTLDNNGQDVNVEAAANMMGETVAPAAELPASTRYIRFRMPGGNGTFEIKARASKQQ